MKVVMDFDDTQIARLLSGKKVAHCYRSDHPHLPKLNDVRHVVRSETRRVVVTKLRRFDLWTEVTWEHFTSSEAKIEMVV